MKCEVANDIQPVGLAEPAGRRALWPGRLLLSKGSGYFDLAGRAGAEVSRHGDLANTAIGVPVGTTRTILLGLDVRQNVVHDLRQTTEAGQDAPAIQLKDWSMEKGRASETAILTALMRAAHLVIDSEPWILKDNLAGALVGVDHDAMLRSALSQVETELSSLSATALTDALLAEARSSVTLRSRYAEDELSNAMERGVSQYVVLGSGFDSFAYRRLDLAAALRIFEVDHPATQRRKLSRLRELHLEIPPHVAFVPLNFEEQSLFDGLRALGFRDDQPAFFSWLGVTWFLTEEAIVRTLSQVAAAASGSEIVFDYPLLETLLDDEARQIARVIESMGANRGEPIRSRFEPADLTTRLKNVGFQRVWHLAVEDANSRYFSDRLDGLRAPRLARLLKAQVDHTGSQIA